MTNDHKQTSARAPGNPNDLETIQLLLAVVYDFAEQGPGILSFLDHIGFDLRIVGTAAEVAQALPAFYRVKKGAYDVTRLERDLITWHPVAAGVEAAREAKESSREGGLS